MKSSEWLFCPRNLIAILLLIIAENGQPQDLRSAQEPKDAAQALTELESLQSDYSLTPQDTAIAAAVADGLTTNLALSAGAVESNSLISASPIGLMTLTGLKIGLVKFSGTLSETEKRFAFKSTSALWGGAAINNIAVYLAAPPPIPIIAGLLMGISTWLNMGSKYERDDELLAARQAKSLITEEYSADGQGIERP